MAGTLICMFTSTCDKKVVYCQCVVTLNVIYMYVICDLTSLIFISVPSAQQIYD